MTGQDQPQTATGSPIGPGLLTVAGVACVRGGRTLFSDLGFALAAGDAALVTGPNGAGKSSLLRIIAGLLPPSAGAVTASRCTLMAEAAALDGGAPLSGALRFWAAVDGLDDPAGRVAAALSATGLAPLSDVPVRLLSTGQRRRAALARVVASEAPLWLLDEPANGLDTANLTVLEALAAQHRAGGGAVLIASHSAIDLPGALVIALAP